MTHILFLMSDTGGGHRAASRAIEAALAIRYPNQFTCELVDVWTDYTPYPLNRSARDYTPWINNFPASYSANYWVMNHILFQTKWFNKLVVNYAYPRAVRLYNEHPADIIVCVHSVFVRPTVQSLRRANIKKPYITVITDWARPPIIWYDTAVDRLLVPTQPAYDIGLKFGMRPDQIALTGAPVHPKFTGVTLTKQEARAQLGWDANARIALMVGGGDGLGPLMDTAKAIDDRDVNGLLMIIAGRNENLKKLLEAHSWKHPTRIYGFVDNMQVLMTAADVLITKAGPATITEAAILGLPLVLSGAIQYQESPNADYVVAHNAGVYAPGPTKVADAIQRLFSDDGTMLKGMSDGIRSIAQPDAIWKIADEIKAYA